MINSKLTKLWCVFLIIYLVKYFTWRLRLFQSTFWPHWLKPTNVEAYREQLCGPNSIQNLWQVQLQSRSRLNPMAKHKFGDSHTRRCKHWTWDPSVGTWKKLFPNVKKFQFKISISSSRGGGGDSGADWILLCSQILMILNPSNIISIVKLYIYSIVSFVKQQ